MLERHDRSVLVVAGHSKATVAFLPTAAHPDVMKLDELIDDEHYAVGVALHERVVAMLTTMIAPDRQAGGPSTITVAFPFTCTATITITTQLADRP